MNALLNIILASKEAFLTSLLVSSIPGIGIYMRFYHPIQLYSFALTFFPRAAMLYSNRGTASMKRGNYEPGVKDLTHAIELKPNFALAYYNRGSTYMHMQKFQQAIEDFNVALQLRPRWLLPYLNRSATYVARRDYQHALQDHNQILALQPKFVDMRLQRAITYAQLKDHQRALQDCEAASKLLPNPIGMYAARGTVYLLAHDYQRAIDDYDKALTYPIARILRSINKSSLSSFKASIYIGRGLAYIGLQNYQQALQDSNEALALSPERPDTYNVRGPAYNVRGLAYLGLQDLPQAQANFVHACECYPENCRFALLLVWTELCITGPNAAHAEQLLNVAEADPFHYVAPLCRAVAFWLRNQFPEAALAIEPALTSSSDEWETSFWAGIISASQGLDEEAITALKHSITQGVPPALFAPLTWLKQQRPDFYEQHAAELLGG